MFKIDLQIVHSPEININIRFIYPIRSGDFTDVFLYQRHQVISRSPQSVCHHIRAHAVTVIRIAGLIIFALIFRSRCDIIQRSLQNIRLIINSVIILIRPAPHRLNLPHILIRQPIR